MGLPAEPRLGYDGDSGDSPGDEARLSRKRELLDDGFYRDGNRDVGVVQHGRVRNLVLSTVLV